MDKLGAMRAFINVARQGSFCSRAVSLANAAGQFGIRNASDKKL